MPEIFNPNYPETFEVELHKSELGSIEEGRAKAEALGAAVPLSSIEQVAPIEVAPTPERQYSEVELIKGVTIAIKTQRDFELAA